MNKFLLLIKALLYRFNFPTQV